VAWDPNLRDDLTPSTTPFITLQQNNEEQIMSLETRKELNSETLTALEELIQANIDSANGFSEAAEQIDHSALTDLFKELGEQRRQLAAELTTHLAEAGEEPTAEGSLLASLHRVWLDVRGKLAGGDPAAVLSEAERGEDHIKAAYENVLKRTAGSAMNSVLNEQYAIVKAGHDRIRNLRDQFKNQS
jgi:uncharacterized protein (TIGR02284 family)